MHNNTIEFEVTGDLAMFTTPESHLGGDKDSYLVPTYECIKGITASIYWKPTFIWYIDAVRVMNPIEKDLMAVRTVKVTGGHDLNAYNYLKNVRYQVRAHFEWNENRPELAQDRNENKHYDIAKRFLGRGGRRDIFLGTRECQGYVEPCVFGEGKGAYDLIPDMRFQMMHHGFTYADEAWSEGTKGCLTNNFWTPSMKNGVIWYPRPEQCPVHLKVRGMKMKKFGEKQGNFIGLKEFDPENAPGKAC